jgi:DNA-directed RNA polymerases I, II, and III subunit RPABC2
MSFATSLVIQDDVQKVKAANIDEYISLPWMTKYEFDQLIGLRTMHLSKGAMPLLPLEAGFQIKSNMELRQVAIQELQEKKLPYIIKRTLPNGKVEYWPVSKLALHAVRHQMR